MISTVFFLLVLPFQTNADEGWWSRLRVAGGTPYSQVEHPKIALEKEVLIYDGDGKCEAHFVFRNTAEEQITVEVGFPVKITIPLTDFWIYDPSKDLLQKVYGKSLISDEELLQITELDRKRANLNIAKVLSWNEFEALNNTFYWGENRLVKNLTVTQDGQHVAIDSVFMKGQVLQGDSLEISMHFVHQLFFKPGRYSTVTVKYSSFSRIMDSGTPFFYFYINWRYVLGTGRTWKGPIKTIYILVPDHLSPNLPESFARVGEFKKKTVYVATNYEPLEKDEIQVSYVRRFRKDEVAFGYSQIYFGPYIVPLGEEMGEADSADIIKSIPEPKRPAQNFVNVRNTSSFLPQRTWVNSYLSLPISRNDAFWSSIYPSRWYKAFYDPPESNKSELVVEGVPTTCQNIGFGPLSLFDGLPESAWCEGVKGDGMDEWVEFELEEDVLGLAVFNGFKKVSWCWCVKELPSIYTQMNMVVFDTLGYEKVKAVYTKNNRVKILEINSTNGEISHKIQLKDISGRQIFEKIFLPKGIYRLFIRDVYKGTKWADTCLGEIEFYLATAKELVDADSFLKKIL